MTAFLMIFQRLPTDQFPKISKDSPKLVRTVTRSVTPQNVIIAAKCNANAKCNITIAAKCNTSAKRNDINTKCNKVINAKCNNFPTQNVITF